MTLKAKLLLYLAVLHLALFALAWQLLEKAWVLLAEAVLAASFFLGWRLVQHFGRPEALIRQGVAALRDQDFQNRLLPVGSPELNSLIEVYNRLLAALREERQYVQEQHYYLGKLIEASPTGMLLLDYDDRLTYFNPAAGQLMGLTESLHGTPLEQLPHPLAPLLKALRAGQPEVITLNGNAQYKCHSAQFLHRGFQRRFMVIEELTRELLEHEKKAYGKVIRMMAHEVNNTVGAINSMLHSALGFGEAPGAADWELLRGSLAIAAARNDSMNRFMQNFSRVIRVPEPRREQASATGLAERCCRLIQADAVQRGIVLSAELPDAPVTALMDTGLMEQALLNILRNALEAAGPGGEVRLTAGSQPPRLAVWNNGPGIPPDVASQLFTPFFSTKPQGQGIGLTLVREILGRHGFAFSLETQPDGWTVFRIDLQ
ncbi:MAG: ATP-binding protein [Bacteroidia bacterium]|nr:ATP-binding protein [Bacteroidia bacterium]